MAMAEQDGGKGRAVAGRALAVAAGGMAAMAAIFAKFASPESRWEVRVACYGGVAACNVAMWTLYVRSLTCLSSLQATVFNFAANFLLSGLAGFLLFGEAAHFQWLMGASLIVMGITVLSKADVDGDKKEMKQE
ncbi:hypothetical protein M758_12G099300 [Ceratodon purpureus]|uniref:EamA domain-containing protein n=1 Tax=Ceratodon purpureus TaxID=3225 RepID=A0A8T0G6L3_CERPU|nr:hypothetical protein KC19_12G095200 [Ceratodon purpureus]KAG0598764.1 hypothetical protein M758_12G099300 [Ceratodon purpureus]